MPLPKWFCWTRFGTEAGQKFQHILERKEQERSANSGIFFWGIGNAVGPSIKELIKRTHEPEVLFSPTKSPAREADARPLGVAVWTTAQTLFGSPFELPEKSLVTSRHDPQSPRAAHYALVCHCEKSLFISESSETIVLSSIRNILTGRPVGTSQVTAIVESDFDDSSAQWGYHVALRARLVPPFLLRLQDPIALPAPDPMSDWSSAVLHLWKSRRPATQITD